MKKILDQITEIVGNAFKQCGYDDKYGKTGISNRPDLCEYQCNGAMAAAKEYKKAPFMIGDDHTLGVHGVHHSMFIIILSPVGSYYKEGLNPVPIMIETEDVRVAGKGGTGYAKCGGNYAGSLAAQVKAEELGYSQVLWLDGVHRKYIEEVGSMNVMFEIDNKIVTAPCEGTVLPGVTRDSILHILKDWGYEIEERHLSVDELMEAGHNGKLQEAWGTGTAAVISPIGELYYKGDVVTVSDFKTGELTQKLYDTLTGIQWGTVEDPYGWTVVVD